MERKNIQGLLGLICFATALIYLADVFLSSPILSLSFSLLSMLLLFLALIKVRLSTKITALLLLVAGTVTFFFYRVDKVELLLGFGQNANLLTLFIVVPFFALIISIGGYLTSLQRKMLVKEREGQAHPYRISSFLTAAMGPLLNLGTLAIVHRMAQESFTGFEQKKMGMILQRTFGFCMFWSPYFVNVGLVMVLFDLSWADFGGTALLMAVSYLLISLLFNRWLSFSEPSKDVPPLTYDQEYTQEDRKKLRGLLLWSLCLLLLSFLLDFLLPVNMLTIVSVLAILFPPLWAVLIGQLPEYIQVAAEHIARSFDRFKNELVVFISAGYFGVALAYSPAGLVISELILTLSNGSAYWVTLWIIFITVMLGLLGIHPVVVLIGIGGSISPQVLGVSPTYLAVSLLTAWSLATLVTPFSGLVLMTSALINESPWKVVKQNIPLITALAILLPFILLLI